MFAMMPYMTLPTAAFTILLLLPGSYSSASGVMSDADTEKKREGRYITGIPLANYTSDTGLGLGAGLWLYNNGARDSEHFRRTPYYTKIYLQYFATTLGWEYDTIKLDMPYVAGSRYRLRLEMMYERDIDRKYFGSGDLSQRPLPAPTYSDYLKRLEQAEPLGPGSTNRAYHRYKIVKPVLLIEIERELTSSFKMMSGIGFHKANITTFGGKTIDAGGQTKIQGPTLLELDAPAGINGGWTNYLRFGIAYDTRDFELAPKNGWYADVTGELSHSAIGSDFSYARETITVRRYQTILPRTVLAARGAYSVFQGTPPFFTMSTIGFFHHRPSALGGGRTIRGYKMGRFTGRAMALANAEIRHDILEGTWGSQHFLYTVVAFADGGRAFASGTKASFADWKGAAGGGLRIAWNQATIINATYGASGEDSNISIGFGHQF